MRQALFNRWQFDIAGRAALDLFAGSGALGLEALSRGASSATFVESDPAARRAIEENLRKLRYADRATVVAGQLPDALAQAPPGPYGLVFLAPPYHSGAGSLCLGPLRERGLLAPGARVVLEVHAEEPVAPVEGWAPIDDRHYGITRLLFLEAR